MKLKEIKRTANIAWSPPAQHPIYLAAGTAAQQLDATFSTSAALEIYGVNFSEPGLDMPLVGSLQSEYRFHKLAWGGHGMTSPETASGLLVGGAEKGNVLVYNPAKLIKKEDPLVFTMDKHSGNVAALDFNPFQQNLLATGASESEIYIWDMNNPTNPMTPGAKSQPADDVNCISWNKQVQHILASTFSARCVVWDLRKNDPIIKISDSMSRIKSKMVNWHPDVATQMCLSSEDDHTPVIQLWDLRFATSPLKVLENHQRGILSIAWCPQDADLLLSCGKDNRILCWNPNSEMPGGEVVCEVPTRSQWCFDIQWCPRNPAVISSASFDGHINLYSLMGGEQEAEQIDAVADSFPSDPFVQAPQQTKPAMTVTLKKPPKWLRRPVGASFGFGGCLVSFEASKPPQQQQAHQPVQRQVFISRVVTENDLVARSSQLESALGAGQFQEFCAMKIANCQDPMEESIWNFMKVNFERDPRKSFLNLLGYDQNELSKKVSSAVGTSALSSQEPGVDASELAEKMSGLGTSDAGEGVTANGSNSPNVEAENLPKVESDSSLFEQIAAHEHDSRPQSPFTVPSDDDVDGLISQSVITGNFEAAVEMCLHDDRMAEAILLAICGGPELLARTQKKFFHKNRGNLSRLISSVVNRDWTHIVETCELNNWKEALAVILTYAKQDELPLLCDTLGIRLENEQHGKLSAYAILCYICSGNIDYLVECWVKQTHNSNSPQGLQDLVEKVMVLRKAVENIQGQPPEVRSGVLTEKLSLYAEILAAQGSFATALGYLGNSNEIPHLILRDRLYRALGQAIPGMAQPPFPFKKIEVHPPRSRPVQQPQQPQQPSMGQQATARGMFQTVTTPSTGYYNDYGSGQTQYSRGMNGPLPTQPTYSEPYTVSQAPPLTPPTTGVQPGTRAGPLSQRYPTQQPYVEPTAPTYMQPEPNPGHMAYGQPAYNYGGFPGEQPSSTYQQPPPAVQVPHLPSYQEMRPESGWNDPPVLSGKSGRKKSGDQASAPAPIPSNLYNPAEHAAKQPEQAPPTGQFPAGGFYNPQDHQPPPQPPQQTMAAPAPTPSQPIEKGPIPAEHQVLQDIFNDLNNRCLNRATNPQMKRKLEDVQRKLEALYDKLRANALSDHIILGLHQMIQAIQQFDYPSGLAIHTRVVSESNFSEISAFMPGIKDFSDLPLGFLPWFPTNTHHSALFAPVCLVIIPFAQDAGEGVTANGSNSPNVEAENLPKVESDSSLFEQIAAHEHDSRPQSPFTVPSDDDVDGLISQSVITGNFEAAVEMCLHDDRMAEAILLAICGGPELLARTQKKFFHKNRGNLSRLISSVVNRDWTHIVETCELNNWKEALAVILTYAKQDELPLLCDTLGIRLENEQHGKLSAYAILCYICSGNIDYLVECWVKQTHNSNSPQGLQDLVEKVMVLRKAVENIQGQPPEVRSGVLTEKLSLYAEILAAQGSFATALGYLGNSNEIPHLILRDRLYRALGQAIPGMAQPPFPFKKIEVHPPRSRPVQQPQQPQQPSMGQQATARGMFQTVTTPSTGYYNDYGSGQTQYSRGMNGPLPTQPTYSEPYTVSQAPPLTPPTTGVQPGTRAGPLSQRYPTQQPYVEPTAPTYMQPEPNPGHMAYGQPAYNYGGFPGEQPSSTYQPPPPAVQVPHLPSYQEMRPESGWNDPPVLSGKSGRKKSGDQASAPAPIPSNLYNPAEHAAKQPEQAPPTGQFPAGGFYNPQEHQPPPQPPQQTMAAPAPTPSQPIEKGPIPAEHQVLQDIFNDLNNRCLNRATNPQMKRKLEDVQRKLEALYDKLRANALSDHIILGLHQMIQAIQQFDYPSGLAIHTRVVSESNFSEISAFMPGIKVLFQTAQHLQVYLQ
ncbi:protein transport protein Sec31A-like [Lingula anatina]|uniref:Protein transport protein Sec31A n=1 Tax=Lingula anatina TaxID=7574 RepID=A0A1S3HF97_LINAN|nr:protein transport protein Sec31A-like [Lingula anatina]|eukprot:XP_013384747.1 protein transport protein Sec31A-like [Lingula anatina]